MHTHSQVKLQFGAEIPAIAKLGKKKDATGSAARNNIWHPAVLQVAEIKPLREKRCPPKVSIASGWLIDMRFSKYLKGRALASN